MFPCAGCLILTVILSVSVSASVIDGKEIKIDLTTTNALAFCEWTPTNRYDVTREGVGWDGLQDNPFDYSFQMGELVTKPFAIGYFWRPAKFVRIRAELQPGPMPLKTGDGRKYWSPVGRLFARHSPDLKHWSSWQTLTVVSTTNHFFEGDLRIAGRDQTEYERMRVEYSGQEQIPWSSDEEAAVKWILHKDPDFFRRSLPFIGYVQLLFEGEFIASRRFREMKVNLSYSVGGLHSPPPDKKTEEQMWSVPWRFEAR